MLLLKCSMCNSKKSKFLKEQETTGLLTSLGKRTLLSQIPLLDPLLFYKYKMNEIINKKIYYQEINLCQRYIKSNLDLHIVLVVYSLKIKKEQKSLKKQEIQDTFIKTN